MAESRLRGAGLAVVTADGQRLPEPVPPPNAAATVGISIAVLPFADAGDGDSLGEAIAEDVMMECARFQNITVAPRGATFACRGFADDTARVARELGVEFVLEGTLRRGGGRMRIGLRLLDGATGRLIASERLEWPAGEAEPEEVARLVTARIVPEVDRVMLQRAERLPEQGLGVPDLTLRARALLLRGAEAEDATAIDVGVRLAAEAIRCDPWHAEAWHVLALGHCIRGERGAFSAATQADYAAAEAAVARLRALEPNGYAPHAIGGHLAMRQGRHAEALESLRHALALNPNAVTTLRWLAWEESNHGLGAAAREHAELSLRLSPRDHMVYLGHWTLALAHWVEGDLAACAEHVRRAVALTPRFGGYYILLAACLAEQGDLAGAAAAVARVRQNCPGLIESRLAGKTYFVDPALAARYQAALARAAGVGARPVPVPTAAESPELAALSVREREVLRLVARGSSNVELAAALGISGHTAKRHVANILLKLNLPTRSAAATLAGRHGLI